jgi:hypothetical protein
MHHSFNFMRKFKLRLPHHMLYEYGRFCERIKQGCGLGLERLGLETSRDVSTSRLGLVSEKMVNVSVSSRSRFQTSREH